MGGGQTVRGFNFSEFIVLVSLLAAVSFAADTDVIVPYNVRNVNFRDGVRGELVYEQGNFFVFEDTKKVQVQKFNLNGLARGITYDLLQHYESTRNVLFDVKKSGDTFEIYTRFLLLGGMNSGKFDSPKQWTQPQSSGGSGVGFSGGCVTGSSGGLTTNAGYVPSFGYTVGASYTSSSGNTTVAAQAYHNNSQSGFNVSASKRF